MLAGRLPIIPLPVCFLVFATGGACSADDQQCRIGFGAASEGPAPNRHSAASTDQILLQRRSMLHKSLHAESPGESPHTQSPLPPTGIEASLVESGPALSACTAEGDDPWSTGRHVACCEDSKAKLRQASDGIWRYVCWTAAPAPSTKSDQNRPALAKSAACTGEGDDPWSTGRHVECCEGSQEKLQQESDGIWRYTCWAAEPTSSAEPGPTPSRTSPAPAKSVACTEEGGDPWRTGSEVECCEGLRAKMEPRLDGSWHYSCRASATPQGVSARSIASRASEAGGLAVLEQESAEIPVGGAVRLLAIGSSNALWETWIDQLHVVLSELGYKTPLVEPKALRNTTRPQTTAMCDDAADLAGAHTLRVAKPGWSSWGFAFDSLDDCDAQGYRTILGRSVSCTNGWLCKPQFRGRDALIRPADVAEVARGADVVVLSNWVNDVPAAMSSSLCFKGEKVSHEETVALTIHSLKALSRRVYEASPTTVVVVLAKYPGAAGTVVGSDHSAVNRAVREGLAQEPNIVFADYSFPRDAAMYLATRSGHPNCRGDKVMANAVVEALFEAKVLARGLDMCGADECLAQSNCDGFPLPCCQRSAFCTPRGGSCVPYSAGAE